MSKLLHDVRTYTFSFLFYISAYTTLNKFLECRAVIGQQSVYMTNLWYQIHAVDVCSYTLKYVDQLTLKQMYDQQITYMSSNQRRTHMVRFLGCITQGRI